MRGLSGDLSTMPFKDLVAHLVNNKATGTLKLERAGVRKQAVLIDGDVISASSNQIRERLGQLLINTGQLTPEQLTRAVQAQEQHQLFLGKILVTQGVLTEEAMQNALRLKIRETLLDAFNWGEGSFELDPSPPPPPLTMQALDIRVSLEDLQREGEFRETVWQAIRAAFPNGRLRLSLDEAKLVAPPQPGSLDEKLLQLIRTGHAIDEMVATIKTSDFHIYQRLYALYRLEAVKPIEGSDHTYDDLSSFTPFPGDPIVGLGGDEDTDELGEVGEELSDMEVARQARTLLKVGAYHDAEALARRAFEMSPSAENGQLLREAEAGLSSLLRQQLINSRRIPLLLVSPAKLKMMHLSAPEKYLLSRIDGVRDIGSIVKLSPLQELEALKLFQQFIESGLVQLSDA